MNIAKVIGWKHNHQEGMRCAENISGTLQIVEFPGGIPSQADQDTWTQEFSVYMDSDAEKLARADSRIRDDNLWMLSFYAFYEVDKRLRVIERKPEITKAQFKKQLLALYKSIGGV